MHTLTEKFIRLKTRVGGNREKTAFEYSFGMTEEELRHITPPSPMNRRILAEIDYALHVCEANEGAYKKEIEAALDYLTAMQEKEGVLTDQACQKAEEMLLPMAALARSYKLFLTGHAHIDMNWMWSWQETVAATLATFTTMCNIMDEYPDFTFSQSQASVYEIVEKYDPELMARIKKYIAEKRWEVVATNWVETDKNMPSGESLLRHIEYTRSYLRTVWGVEDFDIDFVPDTFGHAITIPEIDHFGGVRYMYHCRGNSGRDLLYRYRAPSGKELLVLKEGNWYNAAITPHFASGLMEVVQRSSGLKAGMVLYGVGDHGGGPTRRDVERAIEMRSWPIYPDIRFGGLRDYFKEAESVRDRLPVVTEEMNYFAPGCYTTQSRIKRGNRRAEAALYDTEALAALAETKTEYRLPKAQMERAWRDVLFTHFHDILTGSCVQDSREYAMSLYQKTAAVTNTQQEKAMGALARAIDTASMPALKGLPLSGQRDTQSEGAGVGYGIEHFTGVPAPERGSGAVRIFHVYNTLPTARTGIAELTVWDYTCDLKRVMFIDAEGKALPCQMVDKQLQLYWDHRYFRVLVNVTVPPLGYATIILMQKDIDTYPAYLLDGDRTTRFYDDIVLDNGLVRAVIDRCSGRVRSLVDAKSGKEMIAAGESAGFEWLDTERRTSSAWNIGRTLRDTAVDKCTELIHTEEGPLRQSATAKYRLEGGCRVPSEIEVVYSLDAGSRALRVETKVDWQEQGGETIPVLTWRTPLAQESARFLCLIPAGSTARKPLNNDVPAIGGAAALLKDGSALYCINDSKYGYRCEKDALSLTLINSAVNPDPYPERGIHHFTLWLAAGRDDAQDLQLLTDEVNHPLRYQTGNVHGGTLPACKGLIELTSDHAVISAIQSAEGGLLVRGYETAGRDGEACLSMSVPVRGAEMCDLSERGASETARTEEGKVIFPVRANGIWAVKIVL